jgi:peptidoglycan hydrolase-like protein with peptidoglycan-binding domain
MRRRSVLLLVLASMVVSSLVTWVANEQIRSPAEAAARTAPPDPTPILVPVEEKVLVSKIVTRGTAHYRSPRTVSVATSFLKSMPRIVTTAPVRGVTVREAGVLMTISGRPVFLLRGLQPSYRDLGPGMSGPDVAQLERALQRTGHDPGTVDRRYDAATGTAVASLYRSRGFAPFVASESQLGGLRPPEADLVLGARAGAGVQLPADEVVFVPASPVRVTDVLAGAGSAADKGLLTVTGSEVIVDGLLPVDHARLLSPGATATLDDPTRQLSARGTVAWVAPNPGTNGADAFHAAFRVLADDASADLVGGSLRITVPIESTDRARLTVPVSALSLGPDGGSRVRRSAEGRLSWIPVEAGLSADGYVVVTPTEGTLEPGDMVVVGVEPSRPAGG